MIKDNLIEWVVKGATLPVLGLMFLLDSDSLGWINPFFEIYSSQRRAVPLHTQATHTIRLAQPTVP